MVSALAEESKQRAALELLREDLRSVLLQHGRLGFSLKCVVTPDEAGPGHGYIHRVVVALDPLDRPLDIWRAA